MTTNSSSCALNRSLTPPPDPAATPQLKAQHCDPTNFMCTGTKAQKKEALKMIQKIQESITGDAQRVKAYAWKEEHALPPAPKM